MPKDHASPARLEAFSDGVIAVIITIMVLDLKVPAANGLAGLLQIVPTMAIYLLSFTFVGIYWINHHHLVHRTDQADQCILYSNLLFLFFLSLVPFFTNYVLEKHIDSFSVGLYVVSMIFTAASFLLLRLSIGCHLREIGRIEEQDTAAERKHWTSLALYLVAIALSIRYPRMALGVIALVSILWITPTAAKPLHHSTTDN